MKQTATKAMAKAREVIVCAAVEGEEVVVGPEPGRDGFAVGADGVGDFDPDHVLTMNSETQKAVMALEPKTSQGKVSHFPALVSLKWRMSMSQ